MPVLSPHRSSASALAGSYRSTFSSSAIDRPYFSSTSYSPRITSYSERYTTRSYTDSDGRRLFSRSGSITEDGVTSRFREEIREPSVRRDSLSRDSGISSIRENSIADFPSRRDSSISRGGSIGGGSSSTAVTETSSTPSRLSAINVLDSVAELRNKYSPANYVPACLREKNENISRSKSINDIGLPPIDSKSFSSKKKVNHDSSLMNNCNNSSSCIGGVVVANSNNTNTNDNNGVVTGTRTGITTAMVEQDDNGNERSPPPSVADLKKKFDDRPSARGARSHHHHQLLEIEGVKISENRFKKLDTPLDTTKNSGNNNNRTAGGKTATVKKIINNKGGESSGRPVARQTTIINNVDEANNCQQQTSTTSNDDEPSTTTDVVVATAKLEVNSSDTVVCNNSTGLIRNGSEEEGGEVRKGGGASRVNNFASYIPSRDYQQQQQKGESSAKGSGEEGGVLNGVLNGGETTESAEDNNTKTDYVNNGKRFSDISASPKLSSGSSRSIVSPSTSTLNSTSTNSSNSLSRRSTDRDSIGGGGAYEPTTANAIVNKYAASPAASTIAGSGGGGGVKTLGLNGLKNIGNTCFMNSVIQCLSNTKLLLEYLLKDSYVSDINTSTSSMKGALIKAFAEVIKELWSEDSSDRVVNTTSLKSQIQRFAPRFIGYAQQDAQEFLRYLLEGLHEDVNRVKEKPKPIITEIDEKLSDSEKSAESWSRYLRMDNSKIVDYFVGQLKSTLKCTHCGHCSVTFDPFWDLSLPIPQRAGQLRLAQCLDSFTREETLDGDEKPTCSKCKERRKCTKSFKIQKFPKILVIHLKRFSLAERFRGKLSVTVDFPLEGLDMSHYAADHVTPCRYNLYAISNHSGTTYSGHYTAYCRHPYTKTWHEYNDSRVTGISSKSIVSGEAYVLFYEQEGQKSHL